VASITKVCHRPPKIITWIDVHFLLCIFASGLKGDEAGRSGSKPTQEFDGESMPEPVWVYDGLGHSGLFRRTI